MIKDILAANEAAMPNDREMAVLKEYFPACFRPDGSFDLMRFQEYLSEKITVSNEGYELRFLGKNYARLLASVDTTTVVVPDEVHNAKPENVNSQNLYISGDNLDGLKHLLKSYEHQVKCIYIDPPYNTGKDDFAYNDTFNFSVDDLVEKLSIDETHAQRILDLTKRGSSSHSAWLMFMYPRLLLARDLLKHDGVIFVSIDDNEQANLKIIMDDVFGENNLVGTIVWKNATDNNPTNITIEHEYIICFAKNKELIPASWKSSMSDLKDVILEVEKEILDKCGTDTEAIQREYSAWYTQHKPQLGKLEGYKFCDLGGVYAGSRSVHNPGKRGYFYDVIHPVTGRPCTIPLMGYRFPEESMKLLIEQDKIIYGEDESKIIELKQYIRDYEDKLSSVITLDGRSGANIIRSLFDNKNVFKNPKTPHILEEFLPFVAEDGDVILDFFAGSSTTAHAIMNMNITDGKQRKYIMIQWAEKTKKGSEAADAGYDTINQVGRERIIRAAKKLSEDNPGTTVDLGYRHYTLVEPTSTVIDKIESFTDDDNGMFANNTILEEFGIPTVLSTWLVRDGYGFTAPVQTIDFEGYEAFYMDKHLYLIAPDLTEKAIGAITAKYEAEGMFNPENVVLFGYSFTWTEMEALRINLMRLKDTEKNLRVNFDIRY